MNGQVLGLIFSILLLSHISGCSTKKTSEKQSDTNSTLAAEAYQSPESIFEAFQKAVENNEIQTAAQCMTPDAQAAMAMILSIPPSMMAAFDEEKRPGVEKLFKKHGLDLEGQGPGKPATNPKAALREFSKQIDDLPAFIADLSDWLETNSDNSDDESLFSELAKGQLADVKIEGNTATANLTISKKDRVETEPFVFKKIDDRWLIDVSEDDLNFGSSEDNRGSVQNFEQSGFNSQKRKFKPAPPARLVANGIAKKISLSYDAPFGIFTPDGTSPLYVTLEFSGKLAKNATTYGFLKLEPIKDNSGNTLKIMRSKFSFKDATKEMVEFGAFDKKDGTIKIHIMLNNLEKSAKNIAAIEGTVIMKTGNSHIRVPLAFKSISLPKQLAMKLQTPDSHGGFFSFAFHPDGKTVAGGTGVIKNSDSGKVLGGGDVLLWDAKDGKLLKTYGSHGESVDWVQFSNDGNKLVSGSDENGLVKIWNPTTGQPVTAGLSELKVGKFEKLFLSPDGSKLVVVSRKPFKNGQITVNHSAVWNLVDGKELCKLPDSNVSSFAWMSDSNSLIAYIAKVVGQTIVSRELLVFDSGNGKVLRNIEIPKNSSWKLLRILQDDNTLAGISRSWGMKRWNVRTGKQIDDLALSYNASYNYMSFSHNGKSMALIQHMGKVLEVWDLEKKIPNGMLSFEFPSTISHPSFSPDLKRVACSRQDPIILDLTQLEPYRLKRAVRRMTSKSTNRIPKTGFAFKSIAYR